jgi:hypothetical protein
MAFRDFSYPSVLQQLDLTVREGNLSSAASPIPVREEFAAFFQEGLAIAVGDLGLCTEKAKSEFIIAPLLVELRRSMDKRFSVFSGMELNFSKARGLYGACDYILTKGSNQHLREAPIVGILEAKNEDSCLQGLGQCVAAMFAAQARNLKAGWSIARVFGAITTGRVWHLLYLEGNVLTLDRTPCRLQDVFLVDRTKCRIEDLSQLMGVLKYQIECALSPRRPAAAVPTPLV